jgi:hypothetical protein
MIAEDLQLDWLMELTLHGFESSTILSAFQRQLPDRTIQEDLRQLTPGTLATLLTLMHAQTAAATEPLPSLPVLPPRFEGVQGSATRSATGTLGEGWWLHVCFC